MNSSLHWITKSIATAMTFVAIAAFAQPPGGPPPPRGDGPPHDGPRRDGPPPHMRGPGGPGGAGELGDRDVRELVEILRAAKVSKALGLSEEESFKLFQAFEEQKGIGESLEKEIRASMEALKKAVRDEGTDEEIEALLDKTMAAELALQEHRVNAFGKLTDDFTMEQRAKFYIIMHDFDDDMRRMVHEARKRAMGDRGGDGRWRGRGGDGDGRWRDGDKRDGGPPPEGGPRPESGPPPEE